MSLVPVNVKLPVRISVAVLIFCVVDVVVFVLGGLIACKTRVNANEMSLCRIFCVSENKVNCFDKVMCKLLNTFSATTNAQT